MPVIGVLHHASPDVASGLVAAFQQGLKETGFVENQNVQIEYRWAQNHHDRLPQLAADLVRRQVADPGEYAYDAGGEGGDRHDTDRVRECG
jgi:putative ABC transport system substrate-binding protein